MISDIALAIAIYLPWIILRVLSPHRRSTWMAIGICATIAHRLLIIALVLWEAFDWRNGRPTAILKDLLQEDMGYVLYLPILILEGLVAGTQIWREVKAKTYVLPTASQVTVLAFPDLAVFASLGYFAYTCHVLR